jgi:hypothetical protein
LIGWQLEKEWKCRRESTGARMDEQVVPAADAFAGIG